MLVFDKGHPLNCHCSTIFRFHIYLDSNLYKEEQRLRKPWMESEQLITSHRMRPCELEIVDAIIQDEIMCLYFFLLFLTSNFLAFAKPQ